MKVRDKFDKNRIGDLVCDGAYKYVQNFAVEIDGERVAEYDTLGAVAEAWEDYEEPKDFWYIDDFMIMCGAEGEFTTPDLGSFTKKDIGKLKEIGNYFETKEEAEKAAEKLKVWKRLKDSGFKFTGFEETDRGCLGDFTIYCCIKPDYTRPYDEVDEDLDMLFGGEE